MARRCLSDTTNNTNNPYLYHGWGQPTLPAIEPSHPARPLSDIRELTESSVIEPRDSSRPPEGRTPTTVSRQDSTKQSGNLRRRASVRIVEPSPSAKGKQRAETDFRSNPESGGYPAQSTTTIKPSPVSVPLRSSSRSRRELLDQGYTINSHEFPADRGRSTSPIPQAAERFHPLSLGNSPGANPLTFVRNPCPFEIVDHPVSRHNRISIQPQVIAPLFVGGGSIEGFVRVLIDDNDWTYYKRNMLLSRISVDLLGVEELVGQHRRSVFLCLATDIVDAQHPPPAGMVETDIPISRFDTRWILKPSHTSIPFRISLPLDVGPAPFNSTTARIRYTLCASIHIHEDIRKASARSSRDIIVLSTFDPERALRSLPSPLTAYDEIHLSKNGTTEIIRLTAGLHRQVWVSGTSLFVDVQISNNSRKHLKKLGLSIERDVLHYRHAAAATLEKSATQARIFQDKEQTLLNSCNLKPGNTGWDSIPPHTNIIRTCEIDIPRNHATVRCGKFFEVRYFLNVTIGTTHIKYLSVQLPIILIHMNSLDVVPNAVNQVAAAIEEKRAQFTAAQTRKTSNSGTSTKKGLSRSSSSPSLPSARHKRSDQPRLQGQAFAAPRQQSLERMRAQAADMERLGREVRNSPRKARPRDKALPQLPRQDTRSPTSWLPASDGAQDAYFRPILQSAQHVIPPLHIRPSGAHIPVAGPDIPPPGLTNTVRRTLRPIRSAESSLHRPSEVEEIPSRPGTVLRHRRISSGGSAAGLVRRVSFKVRDSMERIGGKDEGERSASGLTGQIRAWMKGMSGKGGGSGPGVGGAGVREGRI